MKLHELTKVSLEPCQSGKLELCMVLQLACPLNNLGQLGYMNNAYNSIKNKNSEVAQVGIYSDFEHTARFAELSFQVHGCMLATSGCAV